MNTNHDTCNPHRRIQATAVQKMCGDISAMTLHRWLHKPELDFPRPMYIGRRRYWREIEVIDWLESQNIEAA
ncbi:helix-turn-helix transcriptional regulator [Roseovarius sp.]|uniref:helix-turn-helix transcriptional regulator n=1 Tax=Roseovarius sp. TaxID=1486281 RepID=UPI003BACD1B5